MPVRGGVKNEVWTFGTASFFSLQRIGIYVEWVGYCRMSIQQMIYDANPPYDYDFWDNLSWLAQKRINLPGLPGGPGFACT